MKEVYLISFISLFLNFFNYIMFRLSLPNKTNTIVIVIAIFFVGAYYVGLGRYTSYYLRAITNPLIGASNYLSQSLADFFSLYLSRADLSRANDLLARQNIALSRENATLKILRAENNSLRKELAFTKELTYNYVVARVIGQPLGASPTEILINEGGERGLMVNQAVTSAGGVIIGKISQVTDNFARVRLLIDNESKLAVLIYGDKPASGLALGQHNLNLKAEMIDKDALIKEGDLVTTSGLEENIPASLIVGRVTRVDKNEEKFWQETSIEPALDYSQVQLVTVVFPEKKILTF